MGKFGGFEEITKIWKYRRKAHEGIDENDYFLLYCFIIGSFSFM